MLLIFTKCKNDIKIDNTHLAIKICMRYKYTKSFWKYRLL